MKRKVVCMTVLTVVFLFSLFGCKRGQNSALSDLDGDLLTERTQNDLTQQKGTVALEEKQGEPAVKQPEKTEAAEKPPEKTAAEKPPETTAAAEKPQATTAGTENRETFSSADAAQMPQEQDTRKKEDVMKITVGNTVLTAELADNSSAAALKELLAKGPLTISMKDYAHMEKVGPLGVSLPRNDELITTGPGDIILYQGNSFVIYYDRNEWSLTRIGKINGITQADLKTILGNGDVTVKISL